MEAELGAGNVVIDPSGQPQGDHGRASRGGQCARRCLRGVRGEGPPEVAMPAQTCAAPRVTFATGQRVRAACCRRWRRTMGRHAGSHAFSVRGSRGVNLRGVSSFPCTASGGGFVPGGGTGGARPRWWSGSRTCAPWWRCRTRLQMRNQFVERTWAPWFFLTSTGWSRRCLPLPGCQMVWSGLTCFLVAFTRAATCSPIYALFPLAGPHVQGTPR